MKKKIIRFFSLLSIVFINNCTTAEIPLAEEPITTVTYNGSVKAIIDNNCITCHISSGIANFLPLLNYDEVRNSAETGPLITRINDAANPMPQSGLLSAETRAIIDTWKEDGFLEN